jgi:hypothetical protein
MATITGTSAATLGAAAVNNIREDLGNVIYNVSPFQTPFTSGIAQTRATNDNHEWLTDSLRASVNTNKRIEADSSDQPTAATGGRVRIGNQVQIASEIATVTKKAEFFDRAGVPGKEMAYQLLKRGKELQMDVEKQMLATTQTKVAAAAGTAGVSASFGTFIVANQKFGGDGTDNAGNSGVGDGSTAPSLGSNAAIDQTKFDNLLDGVWNESGDFGNLKIMAPAATVQSLRNTLKGISDDINTDAASGEIIARVAVYVSQFGPIAVVPNKHMEANTLYLIDMSTWAMATAGGQKIHTTELSTSTSAEKMLLETYYTLEARSEAANGAYYDIS